MSISGFSESWGSIYKVRKKMSQKAIRKHVIFWLMIITALGFTFKFYSGTARWWFNNHGAGALYEVFWILVIFFFLANRQSTLKTVILVFAITCGLEILQLWHPRVLEQIRSTFLGSALIGTTFSWWDFPHYAIGCAIGWLLMQRILNLHESEQEEGD